MKLEDEQPCELDVSEILKDPSRREMVIRSLQEALSAFGYRNTLSSLEKQSKIPFLKDRTTNIETLLNDLDYEAVKAEIKKLQLPSTEKRELMESIEELQIIKLINQGEDDGAIKLIAASQDRSSKYYETLALDLPSLTPEQLQKRHAAILQKCKCPSRQPNNRNALSEYLLANAPIRPATGLPKTVVAQSETQLDLTGAPQFVKLNHSAERLLLLSENNLDYEVSLWSIAEQKVVKICDFRERSNGGVTAVEWSCWEVEAGELIGVCSYDELVVLRAPELNIAYRVSRITLDLPRLLTFAWHPHTHLLYLGGVFPKLLGVDPQGEVVSEVCPFMPTRKVVISPKGELFAIRATLRGELVRFNLEADHVEAELIRDCLFMDLRWQEQKVLATNSQLIFILNPLTLHPIHTCEAPQNPKLFTIEAFLCGDWLLAFNEKLRATLSAGNSVTQAKWDSCEAVDICGRTMATIGETIKIWSSADKNAEVLSYEWIADRNSESASSCSQLSSSSSDVESSEVDPELQHYRELMEIEFLENDDANSSE